MGRWPTSLIKSWESALFSRRYGVHGAFLEFLCRNWCSHRLETGVSGNLWSCPKEAKPIFLYDGEWGIAVKPMLWYCSSLQVNLGYTELFHILAVTQYPSRLLRDFWGTLCSSIKEINASYLFDWDQGIALQAMQGNRASSLSEGDVSWFFSSCGGNLGYILELRQG